MPLDQQRSAGGGQDEPLLRVQDLSVVFPTRKQRLVAVDEVSFNIRRGEILGVVGESGAGKSITGNAVMSLIEPPGFVSGGTVKCSSALVPSSSATCTCHESVSLPVELTATGSPWTR